MDPLELLVTVSPVELLVTVPPGTTRHFSVNARSVVGEATADFRLPASDLEFQTRVEALYAVVRAAASPLGPTPSAEEQVERLGVDLFEALFPDGRVRDVYRATREVAEQRSVLVRLRLSLEQPELRSLPWEYVRDPERGEFLGLSPGTSLVRYIALPREIRPLATRPPLRVLGMRTSSSDQPELDLDTAERRLREALRAPVADGLVELTWLSNGTWRGLQQALRDGSWHIFHFVGDGGFDEQHGEGFVLLADESARPTRLSATGLGRMLGDHETMRLAVMHASAAAQTDSIDMFSSTATTLVRRGTPGVVAMQHELTEGAATEFDRSFFAAIADGVSIDAAITMGRRSIVSARSASVEWGAPATYTSERDAKLFELPGSPEVDPTSLPAGSVEVVGTAETQVASVSGAGTADAGRARTDAGPQEAVGDLTEAVLRGGYLPALAGAVLGAIGWVAAMSGLLESGMLEEILTTMAPDGDISVLSGRAMWIGLWIAIVGGAYVGLGLFRVADASWTILILGLLALGLVALFVIPAFESSDEGKSVLVAEMAPLLAIGVATIVLAARGVTRLGRTGRL